MVFAVAMYPTINDRILRTRDYYCHFVPAENPKFVIALAFLGHHIPCIVIIVCYVIVFIEIRKLFKTRPQDKAAAATRAQAEIKAKTNTISVTHATVITASSAITADLTAGTSKDSAIGHGEKSTATADESKNTESAAEGENDKSRMNQEKKQKNEQPQKQPQKQDQHQLKKGQTAAGGRATADAKARADRERKSFVTLSYIVIGYVICWVPFHFVYDLSFISPEIVPEDLFTALFWMTYVNSGINPFLYAFSSSDLRDAVVKMLKCRCTTK